MRLVLLSTAGAIWASALGMLWARGSRVLGNDAFYYVGYAKQFMHTMPDRLGDWWPYGYPLLGAAIAKLGLSVHSALWLISAVSFLVIFQLVQATASPLSNEKPRWGLWVIVAGASLPVSGLSIAGTMTEPLFAALVFAFAALLAHWPSRAAIYASGGLAVAAFTVRYAGIFLVLVLVAWCFHQAGRHASVRRHMLAIVLITVGSIGVLCLTNYLHFGRIAGPHPVAEESWSSWPRHFAHFGWSLIGGATSARAIAYAGGANSPPALVVGTIVAGGLLWLCAFAWLRNHHKYSRPLALLVAGYVLAMVSLRSYTPFDALYTPRTALPAVFPTLVLLITCVPRSWGREMAAGCGALAIIGIALAARGMDVPFDRLARAEADLRAVIGPAHTVAVNGRATSLAARFPNRFLPISANPNDLFPVWEPVRASDLGRGDCTVHLDATETKSWLKDLVDEAAREGIARTVRDRGDYRIVCKVAP